MPTLPLPAPDRRMGMTLIMATFVIVTMRMCADVRRHVGDVAVAHAALRDDVIGERLYIGAPAPEHRNFETAVMVEMNVEGRLREAVMLMEVPGQALGQLARRVVIDIAQRRNAIAVARDFEA